MIKCIAFAAVLASAAPGVWGQACPQQQYDNKKALVHLDSTGIASSRFLNPRKPFPVVSPLPLPNQAQIWNVCADEAVVTFANSASGQALVVTIPYVYRQIQIEDVLKGLSGQIKFVTEAGKNLVNLAEPSLAAINGQVQPELLGAGGIPEDVARIQDALRPPAQVITAQNSSYALLTRSEGVRKRLSDWKKMNANAPAKATAAITQVSDELQRLEAKLQDGLSAIDFRDQRPPLSECPDPSAEKQTCTYQFTLFDNGTFPIPSVVWRRLVRFSDGTVRFTVRFFDEQVPASNAEGFLRVRADVRERDSATTWSVNAGVGYSVRPEDARKLPDDPSKDRPFTLLDPYTGGQLDGFNGLAGIELIQTLRDRARARVSARFKNGVLGEKDGSGSLTVPVYTVDVYGINSVSTRFGKFAMFQPARRIAINATGEGFQLNAIGVTVGHIVSQESATGVPDKANQDSSVTILRWSGAPGFSVFKHMDVFGLYGEKKSKKDTSYDYHTLGAQLFFANSPANPTGQPSFLSFSGSAAYFQSERDIRVHGTPDRPDGNGKVWLLDAAVTQLSNGGAGTQSLRTLGMLIGAGTGDDPNSQKDESYLGETSGFTGYDSLFLSSFSKLQDGTPARFPLGTGLANKFYLAGNYTERAYKPINLLWWLARALQIDGDVSSSATSLKAHWFHLDQPFQSHHDAGYEAGLQWFIQVPKGVTTTLGCNRYFPGRATRGFLLVDPMACSLQVALTLQ